MRRREDDRAQAAVELALVLPVLVLLLLVVAQVALAARAEILVTHAAREAARQASVARDPVATADRQARASVPLPPGSLEVRTTIRGTDVRVEVRSRISPVVPLLAPLVGERWAIAAVQIRREPR